MKKRFRFNLILICLLLLVIQLYIDNNVIEITNYEICSENLPSEFDDTTILHVSDLHSKLFGMDNTQLIKKVNDINPDYIMITGDMVNATDTDFTTFLDFIKKISVKYKTYFIVGNHELALSNEYYAEIKNTLTDCGVTILENEKATLEKNGQFINLYGMWYNSKYYFGEEFPVESMEKLLGQSSDSFDILLTHNPKDFETYANWGADLILTGHVHGGMVRLPFVGAVFAPERTLFPKYSEGIYTNEKAKMIVSRGLGRGLTGFRLFNRPELGVITLKVGE